MKIPPCRHLEIEESHSNPLRERFIQDVEDSVKTLLLAPTAKDRSVFVDNQKEIDLKKLRLTWDQLLTGLRNLLLFKELQIINSAKNLIYNYTGGSKK